MTGQSTAEAVISRDEAALYDRQIRLWGLDAQKRLRSARVLLVHVAGLGAEVAKNLVLAGVGALTLCDATDLPATATTPATATPPADYDQLTQAQFFVPAGQCDINRACASLDRVQRLNSMVRVNTLATPADQLTECDIAGYDAVIVTDCSRRQMAALNTLCRAAGTAFVAGDVFGMYGATIVDLGQRHQYVEEIPVPAKLSSEDSGNAECVSVTNGSDTSGGSSGSNGSGNGEPATKRARTATSTASTAATATVQRTAVFSHISRVLDVDWHLDKARAVKLSPTYFVYCVVLEFHALYSRRPSLTSRDSDGALLRQIRADLLEKWSLPSSCIPENFHLHCFGSVSPVCAVVGGVLSQEVIKALSHRDEPLNNIFLFNGRDTEGVVERFGP